MPQYDLEWLGIGFGHVGSVSKLAAVGESSGVANMRKHTHTHQRQGVRAAN